jgi:hypothetical protein
MSMRAAAAVMVLFVTAGSAAADPLVDKLRPVELRLLAGADVLLASAPGFDGLDAADLGLSLRAEVKHLAKDRVDLKLDFRGREGFIGDKTLNELFALYVDVRDLGGRVDLRIGRFATPGGFWLHADGMQLTVRYRPWIGQDFYGGLRSFSTGRENTWMSKTPIALPLAGTQLWLRHRLVDASLSFTFAQDAIELPLGGFEIERHRENEYFLDGQISVYPTPKLTLYGSFSLGSRYDVRFDAANPAGATTISSATLGAISVLALAEWRPIDKLRLSYTFHHERIRLFQSELLAKKPDGTPVEAADGSFQDHAVKLVTRAWRSARVEVQYRFRWRDNTDLEHRFTLGFVGDDLWKGLGVFASIGVDNNGLAGKVHDRLIYSGGLSFLRRYLDLRAGVIFTDGYGSGLTFSQRSPTSSTAGPSALFPYVLESNRVAFVRAFGTFWRMFAGLDVEENLDAAQLRALAQIGVSL